MGCWGEQRQHAEASSILGLACTLPVNLLHQSFKSQEPKPLKATYSNFFFFFFVHDTQWVPTTRVTGIMKKKLFNFISKNQTLTLRFQKPKCFSMYFCPCPFTTCFLLLVMGLGHRLLGFSSWDSPLCSLHFWVLAFFGLDLDPFSFSSSLVPLPGVFPLFI